MSATHNQKLFLHEFDAQWFERFRGTYENINPDRPIETASVSFDETEPLLRNLVTADSASPAFVDEYLPKLGLFLHGPFPLPGRRVTRSAWDCRGKLGAYRACGVPERIKNQRVLDIGCNAGYDAFLMKALGALEVTGIEPSGFYHQAMFLNGLYEAPGVRFMNLGWEELDRNYFRNIDFVNCQGLIYHVREPMALLERLSSIMRSGSTLLMETHVLSAPSTQAQFIEGSFWGDTTYWWIFGDQCLMGMLRSCGFTDVEMPLKADCDSRNPADPRVTVEGHPAGARAWFVAKKR